MLKKHALNGIIMYSILAIVERFSKGGYYEKLGYEYDINSNNIFQCNFGG